MKWSRASAAIIQELDELIAKSTPYSLSSPSFGNPTIHDFVKGLILSTNIIGVIDSHIPNGFRADWGQVIDVRSGNTLSNECDIIIYKGKPFKALENKSMKFVLANKKHVRIVIQVRSSIESVTVSDKEYCCNLQKLVPEVWFFAECCWAKTKTRSKTIENDLKRAGYKRFFYFYRMNGDKLDKYVDYESFVKFINLIKKIR